MKLNWRSLLFLSLIALPIVPSAQQTVSNGGPDARPDDGCTLPEPPLTANRPNLFNDQQEQWLGETMAAEQEPDYTLLPEKDSEELTRLGQKLLAQLPPTPIQYHFRVYDTTQEDLNGFSLAGGYIYASRKLLMDAKSEDEVAGMLAHEIGHIYTHQIATSVTRLMKKRMDVNSIGDRADVLDKYQRMLNARSKEREDLDEKEHEKDELRADAVGLYAMVRAGYAPRALATNLERVADSKGRNGNFLSDVLGDFNEEGLRVRTARSIANSAPEGCKRRELKSSPEFLAFQQALVAHPVNPLEDPTPNLTSVKLDQPIRPALNWVRFSPDGKYVLAQNATFIYVLSVSPLKELFRVYAPGSTEAHFTPDSRKMVFHFQSLRVEEWDVESGKRTGAHELVEYRGCHQSELSPDGKILACVLTIHDALQFSLELFNVDTGKVVFSKDNAFVADERAQIYRIMTRPDWDPELLALAFSPDSKYLVIAAVANNLALDLAAMKPISMHMSISGLVQGRMSFVAPDQLMFDCDAGQRGIFRTASSNVCISEFPSGVPVKKFVEGWESMTPTSASTYVVAGSIFDSIPHLIDLTTGQPATLLRFPAADVHGKLLAQESGKGGVAVGEIGAAKVDSVELPEAPLDYARASRISPDGQYLSLSNESRGAIWNLAANKQMVLTRSFRGAWFDGTGALFLQVASGQARPGQNLRFDVKTGAAAETGKYDFERRQYMDVSVQTVPYDQDKLRTLNVGFEVYDAKTGNLLWKKRFPKDAPHITQREPGVLVLTMGMEKETAWDETAHSSPVKTADETSERHQGILVEMLDSQTGAVLRQLIAPEGSKVQWGENSRFYEGSVTDDRRADVFGDLVAIQGNANNTVVYDARTGARLMAFWGHTIAGDAKLGLIAATNRDQELMVYDTATGKEMLRATVDNRILTARFVPEKKQLLVVTSMQRLYTFDLAEKTVKN